MYLYNRRVHTIEGSHYRAVVPGCAGCAMAHPDFGRSVNPISTRGTDYAHLITSGTPGFSDLPTSLLPFFVAEIMTIKMTSPF